tara:strand:+ start:591 stop:773 length:183 start_codon:yes stop_codon:yes gene_type:complete
MNEQEHFEWLRKEWEEAFTSGERRKANLGNQRKTSTESEDADEKTEDRLTRFMKGEDLDD